MRKGLSRTFPPIFAYDNLTVFQNVHRHRWWRDFGTQFCSESISYIFESDSNLRKGFEFRWLDSDGSNRFWERFFSEKFWSTRKGKNRTSKVQFSNVDQDQLDLQNRKKQDLVFHFWMNLDSKKKLLPEIKLIHRHDIDSYGNGSLKKSHSIEANY